MSKRPTIPERRRAAAAAALPEVKRLVKRFGRMAVANCLAKIRAFEKEAARLGALRKEVAALERRIRT
jgi:hypothetical protein